MAKQAAVNIARRTGGVVRVWGRDGKKIMAEMTVPRG